jgi:hypothetical protein
MTEFDTYLESLADHEDEKSRSLLDPRGRILVNAGVRLNWIGDFVANEKIGYEKAVVPLEKIKFSGASKKWNKILLGECGKSVEKFRELMARDELVRDMFAAEASFGEEPILLRGPGKEGYYVPVDGMHRLVGAILQGRESISAFVPVDEVACLPICEAHVVYDLIRGFQRHAKDEQGKTELYHALKLLARTYENVVGLLKNRFDVEHVPDEEVQKIIGRVIDGPDK